MLAGGCLLQQEISVDSKQRFDESCTYRIHIKGRLDRKWADWFGGFEITYTNDDTLLQGTVPDQAALHGILAKINELGLSLLSVDRLSGVKDLPDGSKD
jgi:hypothetical protein